MGMKGQAEGLVSYVDVTGPGLAGQVWSDEGPWATRTCALPGHQLFSGTATLEP